MTLFYIIKYGNISLFQYIIREILVIFQASIAKKLKYAREMIKQVYIFDIKVYDLQLHETYLANALVNLYKLPYTFYKINLLLKYLNEEFKHF